MIFALVKVRIKSDQEAQFLELVRELVAASRQEPGLMIYELLKGSDGSYYFLEEYRDEAAIEAHRISEHYRSIGRKLASVLDGKPEGQRFTPVFGPAENLPADK